MGKVHTPSKECDTLVNQNYLHRDKNIQKPTGFKYKNFEIQKIVSDSQGNNFASLDTSETLVRNVGCHHRQKQ